MLAGLVFPEYLARDELSSGNYLEVKTESVN